ncbi:MAG: hypothetical protein Q9191_004167 [Dirinaria sp. TL-2023a]
MIPELLYSSYQRYKEDTNVFTTWLSQAARACGFKTVGVKRETKPVSAATADLKPAGPRLKGKARKDAKAQAATAANSEGGQNAQQKPAEAVGKSGKSNIRMPEDVLRVARRAINARKRCSNWFTETESKDKVSTEGHAHFIGVLEQALSILKPCYNDEPLMSSGHQPSAKKAEATQAQQRARTFDEDLNNRFRMLQIEDTDNDVEITAPEVTLQSKNGPKKPQPRPLEESEVWELVDEFSIELGFIVFCFFEDLHRIQDLLKATWREYKEGRLDLMTCTMTTNFAFDLVRRAEEDVISQAPGLLGKPRSYEAISALIFYVDSLKGGKAPLNEAQEFEDQLKITPFDEFVYLSTARILIEFEQLSAMKIAFPQPVPSVRMSYISRPDLLELPQVKKWEQEDEFLSQLLMDMSLNDDISKAMIEITKRRKASAQDELSKGFYSLRREGEVSTWIVFAARVLLDIRDIMGKDISRGYREQVKAGCAAYKTLDLAVEGNNLTPRGVRWKGTKSEHVMELWYMLEFWTIKNVFPLMKEKWLAEKAHVIDQFQPFSEFPPALMEEAKAHYKSKGIETELPPHLANNLEKVGLQPIKHATDPNFLRLHNPLASGTMMFDILLGMEHAGTTLANHHQTIFAIAHLYNAARQTDSLEVCWPEMNELIQVHLAELFSGQLSQAPNEFYSRAAIGLGISAQHFARNKRKVKPRTLKGSEISDSQTSKILEDYIANRKPMASCLHRLEGLIQDAERCSKKPDKRLARKQLKPVEVLAQVREWLSKTIPIMSLDYIKLTRICTKLLGTIHRRAREKLGIEHELIRDGDSCQHGYIWMTLHILDEIRECRKMQEEVFRSRYKDLVAGGPHLDICAQVFQEYLAGSLISS